MSEKIPAGHGLTQRATTVSSNSSDVAIPGESGDVGSLLVERLRAWKHAVGYLEAYVSQTESVHKHLHKEYQKVLKTISEPLREGHHFEQQVGGTASFFEGLRANTVAISTSHTETATALKGNVLPILERLHKEIKDRAKHVQTECERAAKAVTKSRSHTQTQIELLGQHSSAFDSVGGVSSSAGPTKGLHLHTHHNNGKQNPENDPYILKRTVIQRLHKQVAEENTQFRDLIGVQQHFCQFEAHIVQQVQQAIMALDQTVEIQSERERYLYADVLAKGQALPVDFEWNSFKSRYADTLIDTNLPVRTVDSIRFPNETHNATIPKMEGGLSRKGKIMRSYNLGYYVVTPSRYLHEFKDKHSLDHNPQPEISLFLPDCAVGALSKEGKFQISGKDSGSMLSTKHDYAFKATNYLEGQRWHEVISSCAGLSTKDLPLPSPQSPAEPNASPPAYSRHGNQEDGVTTVATGNPPPATIAVEKAA